MTLKIACELLQQQAMMGGAYNRNGAKLILAEVYKEHGQAATDRLIRELDLQIKFGFCPGDVF